MSEYGVSITELKEEKYLVDALREMGYRPEVHHEAVPVNSYYSEQEAKQANIIIRRHELRGACGDIGFARQPDGRLTLIADELDAYHPDYSRLNPPEGRRI